MNKLRTQWGRAGSSLARLSPVQRLAAGGLLAVIVATGAWTATRYGAAAAMVPVLDQAFADGDVVQISDHLRARGVPHEVRDARVLVPSDRRLDVLSDLIYSDALTANTESGFDALVKHASVFDSPSKTDKMYNRAREVTLQGVIGRFKGVRKATVIIDPTNERHIGGSITPSALVDIQTRSTGGGTPRQLATAAVNAVTGAVSTMSREKVKVTIDGASYAVGGTLGGAGGGGGGEMVGAVESSAGAAGDVLERRQQCEQVYVAKVRQQLKFIPDVLVSVSVDLNLESRESEERIVDPANYLQVPSKVETRSEQAAPEPVDAQNGVLANAVPTIPEKPPGAPKPISSSEENTTEYAVHASETVQKTRTPAGKETVVSASVAVPRSYFVAVYQRSSRKPAAAATADPDDALLQPIFDAHLGKIRNLVRTTLGVRADDVTVEVYEDAPVAAPPSPASIATTAKEAMTLPVPQISAIRSAVSAHSRTLGYAAAGAATLLMASWLLRRGGGGAALAAHGGMSPLAHPEPMGGAAAAAASASATPRVRVARPSRTAVAPQPMLDAEEDVDPDLLRQVRELAARQPDHAARVLREWIYEG